MSKSTIHTISQKVSEDLQTQGIILTPDEIETIFTLYNTDAYMAASSLRYTKVTYFGGSFGIVPYKIKVAMRDARKYLKRTIGELKREYYLSLIERGNNLVLMYKQFEEGIKNPKRSGAYERKDGTTYKRGKTGAQIYDDYAIQSTKKEEEELIEQEHQFKLYQ